MKKWFHTDDFGAGCFGLVALSVGISLVTIGILLV